MYVPGLHDTGESVADALIRVADRAAKPIVAVLFAVEGSHPLMRRLAPGGGLNVGRVPTYAAVEDAVRALSAMNSYASWRRTRRGHAGRSGGTRRRSRTGTRHRVVARCASWSSCWTTRTSPACWVATASTSGRDGSPIHLTRRLPLPTTSGYPVVLKTADAHLRLRSDLGGIFFDLQSESDVRHQFASRMADLQSLDYDQFVVQGQAPPGRSRRDRDGRGPTVRSSRLVRTVGRRVRRPGRSRVRDSATDRRRRRPTHRNAEGCRVAGQGGNRQRSRSVGATRRDRSDRTNGGRSSRNRALVVAPDRCLVAADGGPRRATAGSSPRSVVPTFPPDGYWGSPRGVTMGR